MATPSASRDARMPLKQLRTPSKKSAFTKLIVPKLKLGSITKFDNATAADPSKDCKHAAKSADAIVEPAAQRYGTVQPDGQIGENSPAHGAKTASTPKDQQASGKQHSGERMAHRKISHLLSSPDFSPEKHVAVKHAEQTEVDLDVPLACQTAISKRR